MAFPPAFLDEVRDRVRLSQVVGRYVEWNARKSNSRKEEYWACCPFHSEKTPSFHVEDHKGRYHCFGCKKTGDAFSFLMERAGMDFPEAVEYLAREAGLEVPKTTRGDDPRRTSLYEVMDLAAAFFAAELKSSRGSAARDYLAGRNVTAEEIAAFRIGYAPGDRQALLNHLLAKGVSIELITAAGLLVAGEDIPAPYSRFRDRLMFPINDARGKTIAFGGRALAKDAQVKYLNSPDIPLFNKRRVLYNFDRARREAHDRGTIIVAEGYFDVISLRRAGFPNSVAPLGTALTEEQLAILWRTSPEPVICFDGDAAGVAAAYRVLELALPLLTAGYSLRFAVLPEDQDPDEVLRDQGAEAIAKVIESADSMIDVLWQRRLRTNDRSTPERRARFEQDIESQINRIGDNKVRRHYAAEISARLRALFSSGERRYTPHKPARKRRKYIKPWKHMEQPTPELKSSSRKADYHAEAMLIAVVNHPSLLDEFTEHIADLDLGNSWLARLRQSILDKAALAEGILTSEKLRGYLSSSGLGSFIDKAEARFRKLREPFCLPSTNAAELREWFREMLDSQKKDRLDPK